MSRILSDCCSEAPTPARSSSLAKNSSTLGISYQILGKFGNEGGVFTLPSTFFFI